MGLLWALRLASVSERFNSTRKLKKKTKKSSLKTVNHHREGIYTSFKLNPSALTEVVQWKEVWPFSSNWFWGSGFKSPWRKFFVTLLLLLFFKNLFFTPFFTCVVHIASNIPGNVVNWKQSSQEYKKCGMYHSVSNVIFSNTGHCYHYPAQSSHVPNIMHQL